MPKQTITIHKSIDKKKIQRELDAANEVFRNSKMGFKAEIVNLDTMKVAIEIIWGDWKHSHGFADFVMKTHGFLNVEETITEKNDSDCYSSIHYYLPC